jgi:GH35 family endo-1,4-beta-xylanase
MQAEGRLGMFHSKKFSTRINKVKRFAAVSCTFMILSVLGPMAASARNNAASASYLPLVLNKYESWSTNFADVTDLGAVGIHEQNEYNHDSDAHLSIDTTNVNSGGKSIKDTGTVVNGQLTFIMNFDPRALTGRDTVDLSGKTLSIEAYLPQDSPFQLVNISLGSSTGYLNVRPIVHPEKGRWYTYDVDLNVVVALATWQSETYMHSSNINSQADAIEFLKGVEYIQFIAIFPNRNGETYFLIDRLGWETSSPLPAYDPTSESLRKYADARNLTLASTIEPPYSADPRFTEFLFKQFVLGDYNVSNISYWPDAEPVGDIFDGFVQQMPMNNYLDRIAEKMGGTLERALIYPAGTGIPEWLKMRTYAETQTIMENYVRAMALRNKGKTRIWIMFSELLDYRISYRWDPDFQYTGLGLKNRTMTPQNWADQYSPFSADTSDVTMIEAAFRVAHETDPDALLFLEEFASEMGEVRADLTYDLVKKLVEDGTPIDGVGLQTHHCINQDGTVDMLKYGYSDDLPQVVQNIERYQALKPGFQVIFSEADVCVYNADIDSSPTGQLKLAERLQMQAEVYRSLLHVALTQDMPVVVLQTWPDRWSYIGYDPGQSWKEDLYGFPGIVDTDWQPRLSYYALLDELKGSTLPGPFLKTLPLDMADGQPSSPTLRWTKSRGANSYEYCIDTSNNDTCDTSWNSTGTDTYVTLTSLSAGTVYSWQVRARNTVGVTLADRGPWRTFTPLYGPNLALGHPVTASSCESDPCIYPAGYAVDGDYYTRWSSAFADPQWFQVDLGETYAIRHVNLHWATFAYATAYQIQVSDNATDWATIYSTTTGDGSLDSLNVTGSGRYVRIYGTARAYPWGYSLNELEVYGTHP